MCAMENGQLSCYACKWGLVFQGTIYKCVGVKTCFFTEAPLVSVCMEGQKTPPSDCSLESQQVLRLPLPLSHITVCSNVVKCREENTEEKRGDGTFGIAEDHMICGDLKLYWLRFQYNKMAVWVFQL